MAFSSKRVERHPLFNPVILESIFLRSEVKNLKSYRLVCQTWNKIASPFLQNASQVVLIRAKEADNRRHSYQNFISYIETLPDEAIFFRNYHIEHWILNERREKSLGLFWTKCGPLMRELHLRDIIFYELTTIRNVLYYWTPNLESLFIEDCLFYTIVEENIPPKCEEYKHKEDFDEEYIFFDYYDHVVVEQLKRIERDPRVPCNLNLRTLAYDQMEEEVFPLEWEELFLAYPRIKDLRISACISELQISSILSKTQSLLLSSLSFFKPSASKGISKINDKHLVQISQLTTGLSNLELYIMDDHFSSQGLEQALSRHKPTLQSIKLFISPENDDQKGDKTSEHGILQKMQFPQLKKLMITSTIFTPTLFYKMPILNSLKIWDPTEDFNWEDPLDELFSCVPLKEVESCPKIHTFSCGYIIRSLSFFQNMSTYLLNLKVLEAPLDDDQIRVVFKNLKVVEEIIVLDKYLTDSGITGDPTLLTEDTGWTPSKREFPYIGDLKKLQRFSLSYWKYLDITDLSVYHGFNEVLELTFLRLTKTQISETALKDLVHKSSLLTLISPTVSKG